MLRAAANFADHGAGGCLHCLYPPLPPSLPLWYSAMKAEATARRRQWRVEGAGARAVCRGTAARSASMDSGRQARLERREDGGYEKGVRGTYVYRERRGREGKRKRNQTNPDADAEAEAEADAEAEAEAETTQTQTHERD